MTGRGEFRVLADAVRGSGAVAPGGRHQADGGEQISEHSWNCLSFGEVFKYQTEKCLGLKRLAMENLLVNIESNRPKRQDKFLLCKPVISDSCSLQIRITCVLTNRLKGYRYEGLYNLKFCYKKDRFC